MRCAAMCWGGCCPCCLGDPCTSAWFKNVVSSWLKSFCGYAATAQVILLLVSLCIAQSKHELTSWGNIHGEMLMSMGAKDPAHIVHEFQFYRLIAALFLSTGLLQMCWNVFFLMTTCW